MLRFVLCMSSLLGSYWFQDLDVGFIGFDGFRVYYFVY